MLGKIYQVSISNGGVPKQAILLGKLERKGIAGDRFLHPKIHGGPDQALLLVAVETIQELIQQGFPIFPGALGENFTTTGLDPKFWRPGQQFHVGSARIELTKPRAPCLTLDCYGVSKAGVPIQKYLFDSRVKRGDVSADRWGKSGFYARVLQAGDVAPGDSIVLEGELV